MRLISSILPSARMEKEPGDFRAQAAGFLMKKGELFITHKEHAQALDLLVMVGYWKGARHTLDTRAPWSEEQRREKNDLYLTRHKKMAPHKYQFSREKETGFRHAGKLDYDTCSNLVRRIGFLFDLLATVTSE